MNESLIGYVMGQLSAARGRWPEIAEASGVPYRTVQKIGSGKTVRPGIDTVEKLANHFRAVAKSADGSQTQQSAA